MDLLPFAPKRAKASVERIRAIIKAAGLSASALNLPPSPQPDRHAASGSLSPLGRTTDGRATRKAAVVLSGVVIARFGIVRALVLGSLLVISSNLAFSWLATTHGPTILGLGFANGLDAMAQALHGTALMVFLSALTSARYTATQYALFSSLYALPGKLLEGTSGFVVDAIGYPHFFLYTASLSIPALLLIFLLSRPAHRHALP